MPNIVSITHRDSVLYAAAFDHGVYTSTDFGNNWLPFNNGYNSGSLTNTFMVLDTELFAGNESGVYEFNYKENIWYERNEGMYALGIGCIKYHNNKIYVGTTGGKIYISSDQGFSWSISRVSDTFASIHSIAFNDDTIYAATNGYLYYSVDQAISWNICNLYTFQISSVSANKNKLFVGTSGLDGMWLSTDGGTTWNKKNNGFINPYIYSIASDSINTYAGTFDGLYISSDNGDNWIKAINGISSSMFVESIEICKQNIYVCGLYGIYLSTNNGLSWSSKGFTNSIVDGITAEDNDVFVCAYQYGIYKSTNNGNQWQSYNTGIPYYFATTLEIGDSTLFAGIWGHGLWSIKKIITGIDQSLILVPEKFYLSQNYPNPFNPSTKIKYSIPNVTLSGVEGSRVTLKVFDVLGNEVATLVNEYRNAGNYEFDFNAASLSSGIYFYRLSASSFVQTKKMILIK